MLLQALAFAPLLEVEWAAPEECPRREQFVERVAAEADQDAEGAEAPVLQAEVVIEELPERRWKLTLVLQGEDGRDRRQFEGDSCAEVVEAAVVVVAVRVVELVSDPATVPDPPGAPHAEPDADEAEAIAAPIDTGADVPTTPPAQPTRRRAAPSRVGGWLAVQGGVALGVLPGVGGAVGVEGGVRGKWWRAGLAVHGAPLRRRDHPRDPEVQGRFDLVSGEALGCGVPVAGPVVFPLCGRIALGAIRGVGLGNVDAPRPRTTLWSGIGASVGAAWRVTRWLAPVVSAEVLATLRDTAFSVGGLPGALHDTGSVAFRAWLGLEFHL